MHSKTSNQKKKLLNSVNVWEGTTILIVSMVMRVFRVVLPPPPTTTSLPLPCSKKQPVLATSGNHDIINNILDIFGPKQVIFPNFCTDLLLLFQHLLPPACSWRSLNWWSSQSVLMMLCKGVNTEQVSNQKSWICLGRCVCACARQ